jgi:hypothetical protein
MAAIVAQIQLVNLKPAPMPRFHTASNLQKDLTGGGKMRNVHVCQAHEAGMRTFSMYPQ